MYVIVFDNSLKQCQEKNLLEAKKNGYIIPYALLEKTQDLLKKIQKNTQF